MNVFYLHEDPQICAQMHADKHVVKMIVVSGQMMSSAHRVLDGTEWYDRTINNRRIKRWRLDDDRENILYKASHINHPSNIWLRESTDHYKWLFLLWGFLINEYEQRYGKDHKSIELHPYVKNPPLSMYKKGWVPPPPAMPDEYKVPNDSILSYRNFYNGSKSRFATWKNTPPNWFTGEFNADLRLHM